MSNVLSKLLLLEDSTFHLNYQKKIINFSCLSDKEVVDSINNLKPTINISQSRPEP